MPIARRTFIKAGALGAAALVVAGGVDAWRLAHDVAAAGAPLSDAEWALFDAMLPAFLEGVVPPDRWTPDARTAMLGRIQGAVQALPPHARAELRQLGALLDRRLARLALAGTFLAWRTVDVVMARDILGRWRGSANPMLVSAYQALHDLTFAAWYADPGSWAAIGYPGPPALTGPVA